ncbi:MAG: DegV family protein [Chloroflexi bacterium]|jgi:DegV family protein with EDD domain|nr:DegV family protein [Chloroflexota bacterium]
MRIVTDSGADLGMTPEELNDLEIEVVPLTVTLEGKSYREGLDIAPADFYRLLAGTSSLPTTSQPSAGEFAEVYRRIAASDPDILSVHISSGLSGTIGAARAGAAMVPEANITHVDTKTLSAATGWQVRAAAMAAKAGCTKEQIVATLQRVASASSTLFTLDDLKYLIHGGRISHMKGLIASVLRLKPFIGVDKVSGMYVQMGQARTFQRALRGVVDLMGREHQPGSSLRVQVLHAENPEGAAQLRELIDERFSCSWLPVGPISFVLGAHTGPSLVGVCYASAEALGGAL